MLPFVKSLGKLLAILGVLVAIPASIATVIGAFAGQPDVVVEFFMKGIDLMDKLIELADRCLEQCFE